MGGGPRDLIKPTPGQQQQQQLLYSYNTRQTERCASNPINLPPNPHTPNPHPPTPTPTPHPQVEACVTKMISVQPDEADVKAMSREAQQQSQYSQFKQHLRDFLVLVSLAAGGRDWGLRVVRLWPEG